MKKKLRDNRGFTLMETMIALVFFSIALLGCAALYIRAAKTNTVGNVQSTSNFIAKTTLEHLKNFTLTDFDAYVTNPSRGGNYNVSDELSYTETVNENGQRDASGYLTRTVSVTRQNGFRVIQVEVRWPRSTRASDVLVLNGTTRGGGL